MNWEIAKSLLLKNIEIGMRLEPEPHYKIVREVPPFLCKKHSNEIGFRVQIGKKSYVNIPMSMLETLFTRSMQNQSIYNRSVYYSLVQEKTNNRPCAVHSVGKLFEFAGIMEQVNSRDYRIKSQ